MSGKNNIDQLVRDKFAGQQLPINEAHWASTQSFISAQRRRKRRAVAFWLIGLLLVSSVGYLAVDSLKEPGTGKQALANDGHIQTGTQSSAPSNHTHNPASEPNEVTSTERDNNANNGRTPINLSGSNGTVIIGLSTDSNYLDSSEAPIASAEAFRSDGKPKGSVNFSLSVSLSPGSNADSTQQAESEEANTSHSTTQPKSSTTTSLVVETELPSDLPKADVTSEVTLINSHLDDSLNEEHQHLTAGDSASKKLTLNDSLRFPDEDEAVRSDKPVRSNDAKVVHVDGGRDSIMAIDSPFVSLADSVNPVLLSENRDSLVQDQDSLLQDEKRSYKGLFLMPYFGPSLSFKNLSGSDESLLEKRENEEKNPITADLGLMARYGFSNGMYLGSGLNYFKMGENARYSPFEVVNENTVPHKYFVYKDASYFEYTDWDTAYLPFEQKVYTAYRWVEHQDSTEVVGEKTILDTLQTPERVVNNRFSYVELPLLVGYQMPLGKWSVGADIGTGLNFLVQTQGNYPDLETGEYPKLEAMEYQRLTYTFLSNLSIGRQLGKHWMLYGNLRFRNQLTSPQKSNDAIQAKYKSLGLQFKLNYRF